ncbi:hypothetical protein M9H77_09668 [Catharanthus roseus]|uniref:Uncharacterized protein n=1 Tax=Catharanthus roseus TaxID=4058 RepID=A0ACC0C1U8_CATRO|nr:hypothetical protein M9H77_09668 [Catharanthus roseus]
MRDGAVEELKSTQRFSKSRHLEELHKHQSRDKKGQYVDFHSKEFWARQKAKEEATATGAPLPNDLQLITTISDGLDRGWLCGVGLEAAHLRAESSQVAARLPRYCLEAEQRLMRWVEAAVSNVYAAFDEHMRRFAEQKHLPYTRCH